MAGIYVHIPFCKQACHYCDFHFSTNTNRAEQVVEAIAQESAIRKGYLDQASVSTLYFGGGTPSILSAGQIERIVKQVQNDFHFENEFEFTLEANPDDLNTEKLEALKSVGVNRLSIGIQSFDDAQLKWMNRAHNASEALTCISDAHKLGFDNISIDLIYGLPNLSMAEWKNELQRAIDLGIQHISAYCLTVESQTALGHWVKKGKEQPIDEAAANRQFEQMIYTLDQAGFSQYEVSNFALDGFESKHNRAYWQGIPYVGLGPSAHSFNGNTRAWNVANNAIYMNKLAADESTLTTEELSDADRVNEYIMTGLRTKWGIDLERIQTEMGVDFKAHFKNELESLLHSDKAELNGNILRLTKKGLFFADGIASDFFILNHED